MRCLVLGGGGFLGKNLVDSLETKGYFVRSFDRALNEKRGGASEEKSASNVEHFSGNFLARSDIEAALNGIDVCFHLISTTIASTSNANPTFDVETNLLGTLQLLKCAVKSGVKRIVFISSGGTVYGVPKTIPISEEHSTYPTSSYGITKLAIEKYLDLYRSLHGLEYVTLRLANPYGVGQRLDAQQGAIAVFLARALRGEEISIWGDGSVIRDYIYVDDAIDAMVRSADVNIQGGCVVNIGAGVGYSINEILSAIEKVTGRRTNKKYVEGRTYDVPANVLDISAAARLLGWTPKISLEEGLLRFSNWIKDGGSRLS
ncbi:MULTISPECIES: NAD-dependent epimerase/dehydratase family protein [unclassified Rhizobium]|uniref:NAD-dependent epimerase/dehydratase family protein n=1 Tax=unclassified Rhizobium TaxID=2613769 RepID=UPI000BD93580|nr:MULTISPECIES: NAD-dependent epimerase/dehydratase family protein [unclassified Rhizobium]SOD52067.1 UDP-glucose 4-epimerase [Rhizobium sp. AN6A]